MFRCVDKYYLWVWKDGQQKGQGRKFIIPDKNTQTKIVDIEPCVFHSFRSEQTTHVYCNFWMECKKSVAWAALFMCLHSSQKLQYTLFNRSSFIFLIKLADMVTNILSFAKNIRGWRNSV